MNPLTAHLHSSSLSLSESQFSTLDRPILSLLTIYCVDIIDFKLLLCPVESLSHYFLDTIKKRYYLFTLIYCDILTILQKFINDNDLEVLVHYILYLICKEY